MDSNKKLSISVVTPTFNQCKFIEQTIKSVIFQQGNFYIDYIIVDGGSTDNTINIIRQYDKKINNGSFKPKCRGISFKWVSEKDNGPAAALKKGFKMISGDICTWINSDDFYLTEAVFQKVANEFDDDHALKLLTADGLFINKHGNEIGKHYVKKINKRELVYLDYHILQPSTFIQKELLDKYEINERYTCSFDLDFYTRMVINREKFKKINEFWSTFRMWENNITAHMHWKRFFEGIQITYNLSTNYFYLLISINYKFHEIVLKNKIYLKYHAKGIITKIFNRYFSIIRFISYKIITGNGYREE
jgi:glycosyltransferase involved in cell wall biosynthesis